MNEDLAGLAKTPNASRYLQQLSKHWGHRFTVEFTPNDSKVDFGDGSSLDMAAQEDSLHLVLHAPVEAFGSLKEVVEEHVNRFAHREGALVFEWNDLPA